MAEIYVFLIKKSLYRRNISTLLPIHEKSENVKMIFN